MTIKCTSGNVTFVRPAIGEHGLSDEMLVVDISDDKEISNPFYIRWDEVRGSWALFVPVKDEQGHIKYNGDEPQLTRLFV